MSEIYSRQWMRALLAAFAAAALAFWWLSEQGKYLEQDAYDFRM